MNLLSALLISGMAGTVIFIVLLAIRPVSKKMFSGTWHYYSLIVPLVFLLGGAVPAGVLVNRIQDFRAERIHVPNTNPEPARNHFTMPYNPVFIERPVLPAQEVHQPAPSPSNNSITAKQVWRQITNFTPYILLCWAMGAVFYLCISIKKYLKYRGMVLSQAEPCLTDCEIPVVISHAAHTPMLMGIVRPVVVLPDAPLEKEELRIVLAHEMIHFKRKDLLFKMAGFIANAVHWCNPAVYFLNRQLNILCELSCDEKVASEMDAVGKKFYGETILRILQYGTQSTENLIFTTNLCNPQKNIKRRLLNMMNAKKTKKRAAVLSLIFAAVVAVAGFVISYYAGSAIRTHADDVAHIDEAPGLFDDVPELYAEARSPRPAETDMPVQPAEEINIQPAVFTPPEITVFIAGDSQAREQDMSIEEAGLIGAEYIWDVFGESIDGMYVQLTYNPNLLTDRQPHWHARVGTSAQALVLSAENYHNFNPLFEFAIDANTGERIQVVRFLNPIGISADFSVTQDEVRELGHSINHNWSPLAITPEEIGEERLQRYMETAASYAQRHFGDVPVVNVSYERPNPDEYFGLPLFSVPTVFSKDENGNIFPTHWTLNFYATDSNGRTAVVRVVTEFEYVGIVASLEMYS